MKLNGRYLTDAERIQLMLTIEHEDIYAPDDFIPLPETQAAPPPGPRPPATVAALDPVLDDEFLGPVDRYAAIYRQVHGQLEEVTA